MVMARVSYIAYSSYLLSWDINQIIFACSEELQQAYIIFGSRVDVFENIGDDVGNLPLSGRIPSIGSKVIGRSQLAAQRLNVAYGCHYPKSDFVKSTNEHWTSHLKRYPIDSAATGFLDQWLRVEPQRSLFRFCGATTAEADEIDGDLTTLRSEIPSTDSLQQNVSEARGGVVVLTAHFSRPSEGLLTISLFTVGGTEASSLEMRMDDTLGDLLDRIGKLPQFQLPQSNGRIAIALPDGRSIFSMSGMTILAEIEDSLERGEV